MTQKPLIRFLPRPPRIRHKLGDALREVELLRGLLRLAEKAERYRALDQSIAKGEAAHA